MTQSPAARPVAPLRGDAAPRVASGPTLAEAAPGLTPVPSWTRSLHEALRGLGILAVIIGSLVGTAPAALTPAVHHPVFRIGFVVLVAYEVLVLLALVRRVRSRAVLAVLAVMLVTSQALMVSWRDLLTPGDLWTPGMNAIGLQVLSLLTLPLARHRRALVALGVVTASIELYGFTQWPVTATRICDSLLIFEPIVTLEVFAGGLLAMARRHDSGAAQVAEVRAAQMEQVVQAEAGREAARLMHDHVLHALHAVAEDRSLVPSEQVVAECRTTVDLLDRPVDVARLVSIGELVADDPLLCRLGATVHGNTGPMPASVAGAIAAAAHEALANVERHAGPGAPCRVEVSTVGEDGCRVRIVDEGRGFDVERATRNRLGLQRSVRERMQGIGGRATITSAPGRGTVVDLRWPAPDDPAEAPDDPAWRTLDTRRFLALSALPGLVSTIAVMRLVAPHTPAAAPGIALTHLLVLAALAQVPLSGRRPLSRRVAALLLALAAAAWVAVLAGTPRDRTPNVYDLYVVWAIGATAQLVMPNLERRAAVALSWAVVAMLGIGCLVRYPVVEVWHYLNGAIFAGIVVVIGYRVMWMAQDILAEARQQQEQLDDVHLELVRLHALSRLDQFWSEKANGQALPLLRGVAAGTLDPTSTRVRQLARATEQLVRDELVLGPGQGQFSDRLHHLRSQGWSVRSSLSRDDGAAALAAAGDLVGLLGPAAVDGQVLTLSATSGHVNAVVLDASADQTTHFSHMMETLGGTMHTDPDFTRLAVAVR